MGTLKMWLGTPKPLGIVGDVEGLWGHRGAGWGRRDREGLVGTDVRGYWGHRGSHGDTGTPTDSPVLLGIYRCTETGTPGTRGNMGTLRTCGDKRTDVGRVTTSLGRTVTCRDLRTATRTSRTPGDTQTPLGTLRTPGDTWTATQPLLRMDTVTSGTRQGAPMDTGTRGDTQTDLGTLMTRGGPRGLRVPSTPHPCSPPCPHVPKYLQTRFPRAPPVPKCPRGLLNVPDHPLVPSCPQTRPTSIPQWPQDPPNVPCSPLLLRCPRTSPTRVLGRL